MIRRFSPVAGLVVLLGLCGLASCQADGCGKAGSETTGDRPDASSTTTAASAHPIESAKEFYDSRPYFQQPLAHTEVSEGLPDLRAKTCGACHQEIYQEWKVSTHHRAWTDPQFQAELKKSRGAHKDKKDDVGWMCVNCHTPLMNQQEKLVVGLENGNIGKPKYVDNPDFSPKLKKEGITCAGCHVRNGTVYGPFGDTNAPHPTAKNKKLLNEKVCVQCHQAEAHWPSRNLACFFSTGEEWRASKYSEQGKDCQSCHMPKVKRHLTVGSQTPKRTTRRHWFGGSLIAKRPKHREQLEALEDVYGSGAKIEVLGGVEPPEVSSSKSEETDEAPGVLKSGKCPDSAEECRYFRVRVTNAYAGHRLPTGDPERHIDIRGEVTDEGGEPVATVEQRIGSKYEWWPEIVLQYDNRLKPGEHLDVRIGVPESELPADLSVVAHKYRMYTEAYEHHELEGRYVRGRRFHRSRWTLTSGGGARLEKITDDWGERQQLLPEEKRGEAGEDDDKDK